MKHSIQDLSRGQEFRWNWKEYSESEWEKYNHSYKASGQGSVMAMLLVVYESNGVICKTVVSMKHRVEAKPAPFIADEYD